MDRITSSLGNSGYAVIDEFLPPAWAAEVLSEIASVPGSDDLRAAQVGRGAKARRHAEVRTDAIRWISPEAPSPGEAVYCNRMEELRVILNRDLQLGLFELEAHLARFAPGGYYRPHLDRHRDTDARVVSAIVYLDADWDESDGGALRLYTDPALGVQGDHLDILPAPGRLALFLSAEFWHEVRTARRNRHTITGWFRRNTGDLPGWT